MTDPDPVERLQPTPARAREADEPLAGIGGTLGDFWSWGFSDLRANVVRGVLAEFLVARAVGAREEVRNPWDNFDVLSPGGVRIEVKSSAYLQSWSQSRPSRISFRGLTARAWDEETGAYADERTVRADVFVFAVHTARQPEDYDPLDVEQWQFYAVPAQAIRAAGTRSVGLAWVQAQALGGAVAWSRLDEAVGRAGQVERFGQELPPDLRDERGRLPPGAVPGWGMSWWWDEQGFGDPTALSMQERTTAMMRYFDAVADGWTPPVPREQWQPPYSHPSEPAAPA